MKQHSKLLLMALIVMMAIAMVAMAACADPAANDNQDDNPPADAEGDTRIFTDLTGAEVELPLSLIHIFCGI